MWTCDDCGESECLSATTTVRQKSTRVDYWVITGDIEIDWCDNCGEKPRCTWVPEPEEGKDG